MGNIFSQKINQIDIPETPTTSKYKVVNISLIGSQELTHNYFKYLHNLCHTENIYTIADELTCVYLYVILDGNKNKISLKVIVRLIPVKSIIGAYKNIFSKSDAAIALYHSNDTEPNIIKINDIISMYTMYASNEIIIRASETDTDVLKIFKQVIEVVLQKNDIEITVDKNTWQI